MNCHTPEPWHIGLNCRIFGGDSNRVAVCDQNDSVSIVANSRRIVAAVNACEGISTEALEAGVVRDLVTALECMLEVFADKEEFDDFASVSRARAVLAKVKAWPLSAFAEAVDEVRQTEASEINRLRVALSSLLSVINRDKDGSFFICEEAAQEIEDAHEVLG